MPDITLSFSCDEYLRQWFIAENGGEIPVKLRKGSPESHLLEFCLRPKTKCSDQPTPQDSDLKILIPSFRFKNPETWNAITETGRKAFIELLRRRFDLQLWQDIHTIDSLGLRTDELIYSWMESHGIEPTERNFNAIAKRLQRMRRRLQTRCRVKRFRKKSQ